MAFPWFPFWMGALVALAALPGLLLWRSVRHLRVQLAERSSQLAEADERFATTLLATSDYVTLSDLRSGEMIDVNPALLAATGFDRESLIGRRAVDLGLWADPAQREEFARLLALHGEVREFRFDFCTRDGRSGEALITGMPVRYRGRRCLLNLIHDISTQESFRRRLEIESERFRALSQSSSFGLCVVVEPGTVVFHNARYIELTGQTADQMNQARAYRSWHPDDYRQGIEEWKRAYASGQGFRSERRYLHPDGTVVWTRGDVIPIGNERESRYFICTLEDITAFKDAERRLRDREFRLRTVFDLQPDYVSLTRFSDAVLVEVNRAFELMAGRPREEILGRTPLDLDLWSRATAGAFLNELRREGQLRDFPAVVNFAGRGPREVLMYSALIDVDGQTCVLSVARDIDDQERMRRQLNIESERFRALSETSALGVCVVRAPDKPDEAARIEFFNQRYLDISGQTEEEVRVRRHLRRWHPDDRAAVVEEWSRAFATGTGFASERRYLHGDGTAVWARTNVVPIQSHDGVPQFLCTLDDVTAMKTIEQALRERESRLTTMFELLPDYVSLAAFDNGELMEVNRAYEVACGLGREQLIGRMAAQLGVWEPEAERRFARQLREHGSVRNFRETIRVADGSRREVVMNASLVEVDGRTCVLNVVRDIEEQETMRRQLDIESERFRSLADSSNFGICVVVPPVHVSYHNARYLEISGRTPDQLDDPLPNWHADDVARSRAEWDHAFSSGDGFSGERRFVHRDGRVVWARINASPLRESGGVYGFVCTLEDITAVKDIERELREREERLALMFDMIPDALSITRADTGEFVDVNRNWEPLTGISRERTLGRTSVDLGVWAKPEQRDELLRKLRSGEPVRRMPVAFRHGTGAVFDAVLYASLVQASGDEYLMVLTHDMTIENRLEAERQHAESELRRTAEQLQSILGSMAEGVVLRGRDGEIQLHNVAAERIFKLDAERLQRIERDEWPRFLDEDGRTVTDRNRLPGARVLATGQDVEGEVLGVQGYPGAPMAWVLFNAKPLRADDGSISGVVTTLTDITSLKAAEKLLREREEQFVALFQMSPAATSLSRLDDGTLVEVNDAWVRQFAYARDEAVGRRGAELGLWSDEVRGNVLGRMGESPTVDAVEVVMHRRDGRDLTCLFSARVLRYQGVDYLLSVPLDVTRQRQVEDEIRELNQQLEERVRLRTGQLEQANTELAATLDTLQRTQEELVRSGMLAGLGSVVAGVAHELNTPVGNAVTVASSLHERTKDLLAGYAGGALRRSVLESYLENAKASTDLLVRNLYQAHELVANFKQVAVDQASAQRRQFDLAEAVREIVATLAPMYKKTSHTLVLDLEEPLPMSSYPGPLGQVLTNLISNSLVHGFDGREGGRMRIATRRLGADAVELEYSDDGAGMSAETQRRAFDPFYTTKLGRGGSGLGLNIVYNITTRLLAGRVALDSAPGTGVKFLLTLPCTAPENGGDRS